MKTSYIKLSGEPVEIHSESKDEPIFLFDIDYCLFASDAMHHYEEEYYKSLFLSRSGKNEDDWNEGVKTKNRRELFKEYLGMSPADFAKEMDIKSVVSTFLSVNQNLNNLLATIPYKKVCFTNGDFDRASTILKHLELEKYFSHVFHADVDAPLTCIKPHVFSYQFAEKSLNTNPEKLYFFDDRKINVENAVLRRWNAYQVKNNLEEKIQLALEDVNVLSSTEVSTTCQVSMN